MQPEIAAPAARTQSRQYRENEGSDHRRGQYRLHGTNRTTGTDFPIVHTVELLDWAQGGPIPAALANAGFEDRPASPVQGERPNSEAAMA